jgi:hypothetical protein
VQAGQGTVFHDFSVTRTSRVEVTLTSLQSSNAAVGLDLGLPSAVTGLVTCAAVLGSGSTVTVRASSTPHITGTILPGTYCVSVYDVGNLTDAVEYTITVAHS